MEELSTLEKALLRLVAVGKGKWGWYQLEIRLSMLDIPRTPNPIFVLKNMETRGLVRHHIIPDSAVDCWEITPEGNALLASVT